MKILNNIFNRNNIINQDKTNPMFERTRVMGSPLDQIISSSGVEPEKGLKDALRMLKNENINVDSATVKEVNNFLKNTDGTMESKLETIEYAAKKGVDITEKNLKAINTALNDSINNSQLIESLSNSSDSDLRGEEAIKKVDQMDISEDFKEKIKNEISKNKSLKEALASVIKDSLNIDVSTREGLVLLKSPNHRYMNLKDMISLIKSISNTLDKFGQKGMDLIKKLLDSNLNAENLLKGLVLLEKSSLPLDKLNEKLEDLISAYNKDIADSLAGAGDKAMLGDNQDIKSDAEDKELASEESEDLSTYMLERMESVLADITMNLEDENRILDQISEIISNNSDLKLFVVREITQKMIDVKEEFSSFRKDLRNTMDKILIDSQNNNISKSEVRDLISKATEKLDNIIMKSDITLYTSMKGERDLVRMSSDLVEARNMLERGDFRGALDIIKNVRSSIESMKFDPSSLKIEGHIRQRANELFEINNQNYAISKNDLSPSGRGVLELMRSLGLNHEYEVSEKLYNDLLKEDSSIKDNVKMALLKIMQDKSESSSAIEGVEKSLNNLTGQQLLNRNNPNSDKQTLMFNIPIETPNETKNLKLFVNSRDKANSLDWENCSLYFVIETDNYGMTGVKIDIKDRMVNLTIRNDKEESIKKVASPLVDEVLSEFTEIGLKKGMVSFRKLNLDEKNTVDEKSNKKPESPSENTLVNGSGGKDKSVKGFDFKI